MRKSKQNVRLDIQQIPDIIDTIKKSIMIRTLIQEFPVTTITKKPTDNSYTKEEVDVLIDAAVERAVAEARKIGIKKLSIETGSGEFFSPARKLFKKFGSPKDYWIVRSSRSG